MNAVIDKWEEILQTVKTEYDVADVAFNTWLKPLKIYEVDGNVITVSVPSDQADLGLNYISKRYNIPLQVTICVLTGMEECELRFILEKDLPKKEQEQEKKTSYNNKVTDPRYEEAHLNPKYTFDTFVVGSNNKFAQAAALAVAESPGDTYNPLFIYGGAGLGKTHLMHSIAHFILEHNKDSKVLYVTSEEFTNELIETIRNGNNTAMSKFRDKYRNIDVLLVDDIQFIIGKESTQEEFFHTFNSLHSAKKQIIISSDKPPKDMEILEERFRSRFEWGLIADITLPDYETRMAILHKNEEMNGYNISEDVIKYIATNIKSNIRELEGAFNKVMAGAKLEKKEVTLELAEQALKDIISPNEKKIITPEYIISVVSEHYGVTSADLCGNKRNAKIVMPRQVSMYLCREIISTPLKNIGKCLGNRDHTTVMHGIEKIEHELENDDNLKNTIDILKKKINPQG
nr:chromosomal replication initiator protein DnaA [uncultured Blautia sp.]